MLWVQKFFSVSIICRIKKSCYLRNEIKEYLFFLFDRFFRNEEKILSPKWGFTINYLRLSSKYVLKSLECRQLKTVLLNQSDN